MDKKASESPAWRHPLGIRTSEISDLVESILAQYRHFAQSAMAEGEDWDAKAFSAHHGACKSALNHMDSLLKLLVWAERREGEAAGAPLSSSPEHQVLISEARAAIRDLEQEEKDE